MTIGFPWKFRRRRARANTGTRKGIAEWLVERLAEACSSSLLGRKIEIKLMQSLFLTRTAGADGTLRGRFGFSRATCSLTSTTARRMTDHNRIVGHELSRSKCGSFEVCFPDGRESRFFHWDDLPSRRPRPELHTREEALEQAKAFARAERDKAGT